MERLNSQVKAKKHAPRASSSRHTYLSSALDDIKRADSGVGNTAGKDTSNHALGIVARVMNVTHLCLSYLV